ncbi:MAG TPA: substrate-binding domain-containing protein [Terriglobales bacterium]|nr:substrate-binding domain-containing protein [Terriglobales bacterium]
MKEKVLRPAAVVLFAALAVAPCFAHHMAVVVSKRNGITGMTSDHLEKIFRQETRKWSDGGEIRLVLHRSSPGETETLARLNKMTPQQWQNWVAAHRESIQFVELDEDVLKYVENTPGAIGLVDVRSVTDHVNIIRVNGKVPMEAGYLPH